MPVVGLAVSTIAVVLRAPLLCGGQIDCDEGVYWQSLRALDAGKAVLTSVYSSQPPAFLLLLLPGHLVSGGALVGDRATVLLLSLAGIAAAGRTAGLLAGRWAGLLAAALVAADPLFFRQSVTIQAEGPAVALALVALAAAAEARHRGGRPALPLAAAAGCAVAARRAPLLAATGAAWVAPAVLVLAAQHPLWPHHAVVVTAPLALLGGGLALVVPGRVAAIACVAVLASGLLPAGFVRDQQQPVSADAPVTAALRAGIAPHDFVVTDDQFAAALAGRDVPPPLVDTSLVRVRSGDLTAEAVEAIADQPDVDGVLLARGRLSALPGFRAWVGVRFPDAVDLGGGRTLYLRPAND